MASLKGILGTEVVSRADAEKLGKVEGAVVDVHAKVVTSWQVGKGRHASFVDHSSLTGIGDAAAVVDEAPSLHPAATDLENAKLTILGSLVLSEAGDSLGKVTDVDVDTASGAITMVKTDNVQIPADLMLGFGSYALVVGLPSPT